MQHQRFALLRALAESQSQHILLVVATPHSGIEETFRPLLGVLNPVFDRTATAALDRKALVPLIVQRRRKDVETWLGADTPFPERLAEERTYELSKDWLALYHGVLAYCCETIAAGGTLRAAQQRVRHWAAIRPAALSPVQPGGGCDRARRPGQPRITGEQPQNASADDVDQAYRPQVLDALGDEQPGDYVPTAPFEDGNAEWTERQRLLRFRRRAAALAGPGADRKHHRPIVFCCFIPTAYYLSGWLSTELARDHGGLDVCGVTGEIGDDERREKIAELVRSDRRVLAVSFQ